MRFLSKLAVLFASILVIIINNVTFATDLSWVDHVGPVYCTSSTLCSEHCNTKPMYSKGTLFPCCTNVYDETSQYYYPVCYCCTNQDSCEKLGQFESAGCSDCSQVITQYKLAYVDKQCRKRGSKREDASTASIWSDANAKIQPQPRKF